MMNNWVIFLLIGIAAIAIGLETVGKVLHWQTNNIGYFTGIALFVIAIVLGAKRKS
ncbi:hypothetical protein [Brevibacillus migulae]|uniref:hypothetical protein n=1 Tax=Brevibacillus migulae TaxID=1644114 RepID=UPI0014317A88|nr:hypothetical protein [Brevibacillus migulae]